MIEDKSINYKAAFDGDSIASEEDKNAEKAESEMKRRKELIRRLDNEEIILEARGQKLKFVLTKSELMGSVGINVERADDVGKYKRPLLGVAVNYSSGSKFARDMKKYYDEKTPEQFKGIGLVTAATSLLFQVLEDLNVSRVYGDIKKNNSNSLSTRLKVPDIIKGGFYSVSTEELGDQHNVITHIDSDRLEEPLSVDALLAL